MTRKNFYYETPAEEIYNMLSSEEGNKVFIGMDCKTGKFSASKNLSISTKMFNLGSFLIEGRYVRKMKKFIEQQLGLITKGKAIDLYGTSVVKSTPIFVEVDNPYYKCSGKMKLYATPMLEFYKR